MQKKFWQGTNFYLSLIALVLSFFTGFTKGNELATSIITLSTGVVASFGLVRELLTTAKFQGFLSTIKTGNFWQYLSGTVLLAAPQLGEAFFPALRGLIEGAMAGNWAVVVTQAITIANMVYHIFKNIAKG